MGGNSSKCPPNGGLRVHRVYPNGPGDVAGIEPFFDFVLDADGYTYTDDSDSTLNLFTKYVTDHENQQICLNVYNARKKSIREVFIVPQKWDGIGLLGLTLKFGLFTCLDEGAHIVHIHDKSPAQKAGLMPITDYLLGTNLQLFYDLDCVRIHVANQVDKEVVLIVYNSVTETVRRVLIVPRENWGGKGTLGCDLAKGYIHRIPYVKSLFTYPTIESYSTFDSNVSRDVVDTIDLSIGNVDSYYTNSQTATLRQGLSERQITVPENEDTPNPNASLGLDDPKAHTDLDPGSVREDTTHPPHPHDISMDTHETDSDAGPDHSDSKLASSSELREPDLENFVNLDRELELEKQVLDLHASESESDSGTGPNSNYEPPAMLDLHLDSQNPG